MLGPGTGESSHHGAHKTRVDTRACCSGRVASSNHVAAAGSVSRWRRWSTSTSLSPVSPGSGGSPISSQVGVTTWPVQPRVATCDTCVVQGAGWARLNRLRVEETGEAVGVREIQTEQSVHRGLCIENTLSQSWEDLTLVSCAVQLRQMTSFLSY